jgi:hypothetical protein
MKAFVQMRLATRQRVFLGKIFNFSQKQPKNVGGERKNEIFSLPSHIFVVSFWGKLKIFPKKTPPAK